MAASERLLLSLSFFWLLLSLCRSQCEIETGESVIIMDILESRGNQINQSTVPIELPIRGLSHQIELEIQTATADYFAIEGKSLRLKRPIDRDDGKLTMIRLQIACREVTSGVQRNIPVVIRIGDINDNPPLFKARTYETTVSELTPIGTTVFRDLSATDADSDSNGLVEYSTSPGDSTERDGYPFFSIDLPHQGLVTVRKTLDYERTDVYYLTILATDKALDPAQRLTSTSTLTVHVADGDDQDPAFVYDACTLVNGACVNPEYHADVTSGIMSGMLKVLPEPITAKDRDSLNSAIRYSFVNGTPPFYNDYFEIDQNSGRVRQLKALDRKIAKNLEIIIKAEEMTDSKRFSTAKLLIDVKAVDNYPPILIPSAMEGYVNENSPIGTTVTVDKEGKVPLVLKVTDADLSGEEGQVSYVFEVTTHSFRVNSDGYLVVNEANLDRDPPNPNKYTFQVISRQVGSPPGKGASAPVTLSVHLSNVNDNSPVIKPLPTVRLPAGDGLRMVARVEASDADDIDGSEHIVYSIYHVSNEGLSKFRIDRDAGVVQVIDKVSAGQQYSITVQATDPGGRFSQGILDVVVVAGPNAGGPVFPQDRYDAQVSEGAAVGSTVITLTAEDPEKDEITYSLIEGNVNGDFAIDPKSGILSVARRLDREEVSAYALVVKASDPSNLFSTTTLDIRVTDINDQNPVFLQSEYIFRVDEGQADAYVGTVQAKDDDISLNGQIRYSVSQSSDFRIDPQTGEIRTLRALDFESQPSHRLMVMARDSAPDSRFGTAAVTILVTDVQDEKPLFEKSLYEAMVPENKANYEVIQLKARDPDSVSSVTYVIKEGAEDLFEIDAVTGIIRTMQPLDYERRASYNLLVGTMENDGPDPRATATVAISIIDANDVAPIFTSVPLPIRLQDTVPLGTVVTTVVASDADGTAPGNEVRYEVTGKEKAPTYFLVDPVSGLISVKDDLRKEPDSEYRIEVTAKDLGIPSLSATATLTVYVEHIATPAPDSELGFADSIYSVEVPENSLANTLIKTLPVINKPRGNFPIGCRIDRGNEEGLFYVLETNQRDCELRLQTGHLDYERQNRYVLTVRLVTVGGLFGDSRLRTDVSVQVVDANDNKPEFLFPSRYSRVFIDKYIAALSYDAPLETAFLQVQAFDADSGANGFVTYDISQESDPFRRFRIEPQSGFISNVKPLEDVREEELPIRLKVVARDNPELRSAIMTQTAQVLVNVIRDENRMVLVLKNALPDRVLGMKENILRLIHERTNVVADVEKVVSLKMIKNNSIETDTSGSDLWFYAIDPATMKILRADDPKLKMSLLESGRTDSLLAELSRTLGVQAVQIRPPKLTPLPAVPTEFSPPAVVRTATGGGIPRLPTAGGDVSDLGAALIALACIIVVLGFVGIVYHCCMWSRYVAYRERVKRLYVAPRYEPVFVEPSLKEYETQVLQMSIPLDDDGGGSLEDPHLSLTLRGMEGISYIGGHDHRDGTVSAFGGHHTDHSFSTGGSSLNESRSSLGHSSTARATSSGGPSALEGDADLMIPASNPLFEDPEQEEEFSGSLKDEGEVALVETHEPPHRSKKYTAENTTEL
ncbi:Cadherin-99C like protein [Argiope bruennichi]|uniref:Cadherin-99C like protein n=1 Tax=Argiope bruennichi TaxID=94029 RepID=A0A8T0EM74_ARGBR|nr:Cadherin-99C like protein [Argiope bruennichi]